MNAKSAQELQLGENQNENPENDEEMKELEPK